MEWRVVEMPVVGSTNDEARRRAVVGEREGLVVVAGRQTAGRGRLARRWESPQGGLYLSALLRPAVAPQRLGILPIAAGLAVARALEPFAGRPLSLKWPNDVLAGEQKLAGILAESRLEGPRAAFCVVGIGVNANNPVPEGGESLVRLAGREVPLDDLRLRVLSELSDACDDLLAKPEKLAEAWTALTSTVGRRVRVAFEGIEVEGVAERVDEEGALWLATREGPLRVVAADVVHLRNV